MSIKEPDQSVWNRFWQRKNDMGKVYPSSPSVLNAIKKNFKLEGLKVLEVGAGTGRDSAELARLGAEVYVLDFAENSLKIVDGLRARENLYENLKLVRGDAFKAPFPDCTFDLVFIIKHILIAMDKWFAGWEKQFTMGQLKKLMVDAGFKCEYAYGDWMRPNLFYRMLRELGFKLGVELPKYPLNGTLYQKAKDAMLDALVSVPVMHYTQLSIGVIGRKP